MATVLDPKAVINYVLESDREKPESERTVWKIKPIAARQWARIKDRLAAVNTSSDRGKDGDGDGTKVSVAMGMQETEAIRHGLVGWENLKVGNGTPFEFQPNANGQISWDQLDWIRAKDREEIAGAIQGMTEPSDEEMANLVSASPSASAELE